MKKLLLLLPALCLSSQVLAKVSYEDALESNRPYHDANGAVHIQPDDKGLTEQELPDSSQNGDLGHWSKSPAPLRMWSMRAPIPRCFPQILRGKRVTKAPKG
ncbi:hypothetical protein HC02_00265 [Vibrio parahaemolyticus]|nr:hypothetical protein HC02_00265 [Vibrio parahaemolyticus]